MTLQSFVIAIRRGWVIVVGLVLAALLLSLAISFFTTPVYDSTARIFVSTRVTNSDASQLSQGSTFSSDRVKSYAALADSPSVLAAVAANDNASSSAGSLAGRISAEAPPGTVLVDVTASSDTAQSSASIANSSADVLSRTIEQLESPSGGGPSPVKATVVARAEPPAAASWPNIPVNLVVGLLGGLALGILGAVLRSAVDTTIRTVDELRDASSRPVLGSVATASEDRREDDGVRGGLQAPANDEFKFIRTNLQFAAINNEKSSLFVTSSVQSEGKTYVACNLAWVLAEQGYRVCLVDADLRRPAVHNRMNIVGDVGLTSLLLGRGTTSHVAQSATPRLDVIAAGPLPPNPSELLSSRRMAAVVTELENAYDFVIFDCAPALPVPDVLVLATLVKDGLFVIRARSTTRKQLTEALGLLQGVSARVSGVVLNMVRAEGKAYGYTYGGESQRQLLSHRDTRSSERTDTISPTRHR